MKKFRFGRKIVLLLAIVTVFGLTSTAFAATYRSEAGWSSGTCLTGFTTTHACPKSSSQTWSYVKVGINGLYWASAPTNEYLLFRPKSSNGTYIGDQQYILTLDNPNYDERGSDIIKPYKTSVNNVYLRIDNPNSGNNMTSDGFWEGYIE